MDFHLKCAVDAHLLADIQAISPSFVLSESSFELVSDEGLLRNDFTWGQNGFSVHRSVIRGPKGEVALLGDISQIDISARLSNRLMLGVNDLVALPFWYDTDEFNPRAVRKFSQLEPGNVSFKIDNVQFVFQSKGQRLTEIRNCFGENDDQIYAEVIRRNFADDGIARLQWHGIAHSTAPVDGDTALWKGTLIVLDDVSINPNLREDAFKLTTSQTTTVVDHRAVETGHALKPNVFSTPNNSTFTPDAETLTK